MEEEEKLIRQVKGIWIPIEIWENKDLSWTEKVVLMEIDSYTHNGKDFYIANSRISSYFNVSEREATNIVNKLIKLGFVEKTRFDGRHRYLRSKLEMPILARQSSKICEAELQNLRGSLISNVTTNSNNILNDITKNFVTGSEKRFLKPTLEDIAAYCKERGNGIDAAAFFDFYESKGWKIGKNQMKDWKAAVRTWERSDRKQQRERPTPSCVAPLPERRNLTHDEIMRLYGKKD